MSITPGSAIVASDFVSTSAGSADAGKGPKLNTNGQLDVSILAHNFGDGSDGALNFDGSSTVLGMVPSSSVYNMTSDIYATDITLGSGVTLMTNNWRIFYTGTITGPSNATIRNDGVSATSQTGASPKVGYFTSQAGGMGGTASNVSPTAGVAGTSANPSPTGNTPGAGGHGGNNDGNTGSTAGGIAGAPTLADRWWAFFFQIIAGIAPIATGLTKLITPGVGGGGAGGCNGSAVGGNGGGGAGGAPIIWLCGKILAGSFTIKSLGGNGYQGTNGVNYFSQQSGGGGGGGAGDGGFVLNAFQTNTWTGSYVLTKGTPGAPGLKSGAGAYDGLIGGSANDGVYKEVQITTGL